MEKRTECVLQVPVSFRCRQTADTNQQSWMCNNCVVMRPSLARIDQGTRFFSFFASLVFSKLARRAQNFSKFQILILNRIDSIRHVHIAARLWAGTPCFLTNLFSSSIYVRFGYRISFIRHVRRARLGKPQINWPNRSGENR